MSDQAKWVVYRKKPIMIVAKQVEEPCEVETLEGVMKAKAGDYIIRGIKGEEYPCDKEIFHLTYDKVKLDPYDEDRSNYCIPETD